MNDLVAILQGLDTPISADLPGGEDLRYSHEWKNLEEARRTDDGLAPGDWVAKDKKIADWDGVASLAADLLRTRSKDLRLAVVLTEALVRTQALPGLVASLVMLREMVAEFWDRGLLPGRDGEGGFERRAAALSWFNEKLPEVLFSLPITSRANSGLDYSYSGYVEARRIGWEKDFEAANVTSETREKFAIAKREGRCLDLFESAVTATPRVYYENLVVEIAAAETELQALDKAITKQFDDPDSAPGFSQAKSALQDIQALLDTILARKRKEEPGTVGPAKPTVETPPDSDVMPFDFDALGQEPNGAGSKDTWTRAHELVKAGQPGKGLAEMARLAASETSGRSRFQRKLQLAEICLQLKKDRLALTILEELSEQIDKYKLDEWETTDIIGGVWIRLYRIYKKDGGESERAAKLFNRLCRLDPWQTLTSSEG